MDADALLEHDAHVGEARDTLFRDFADGQTMTLYSEPKPAPAEAMEKLAGVVPFRRFSFPQGLEADIKVPDEVAS